MQNCQDAYFATFPSFAELFGYQKQVNDRSTWTHCAVNQLHVEPLNRNSSCYPALKEFAPGVSQEAVEDSFNNLGLAIRFDQKLYPALPTVELPKKCEPSLRKILALQRDIDACQREIKRYTYHSRSIS